MERNYNEYIPRYAIKIDEHTISNCFKREGPELGNYIEELMDAAKSVDDTVNLIPNRLVIS